MVLIILIWVFFDFAWVNLCIRALQDAHFNILSISRHYLGAVPAHRFYENRTAARGGDHGNPE